MVSVIDTNSQSKSPIYYKSPRSKTQMSFRDYDARLDEHQQTYVLSPRIMKTLTKTMSDSRSLFTSPKDKVGFHGPRRPLLLSYPITPRKVGKAVFKQTNYKRTKSASSTRHSAPSVTVPKDEEAKEAIKVATVMRTGESKEEQPAPKKLSRPQTISRSQPKTLKLAKERGFILDGIAVSSIQEDFGKIHPKLGPAIPPYNAHFDRYARKYFTFKGLGKTLHYTGQAKDISESTQGKAIDRFHFIGFGHDYLFRRNIAGAGYSRECVDGHSQFLSDIGPMTGYNGKFGYRRNTPSLRNCPSPFGTATWSSIY